MSKHGLRCQIDALKDAQRGGAMACTHACSQALCGLRRELRTQLHTLLGFAQLLRSLPQGQLDTERGRSYLEHIDTSGRQLLKAVDALRDHAHAVPCQLQAALPLPGAGDAHPGKAK